MKAGLVCLALLLTALPAEARRSPAVRAAVQLQKLTNDDVDWYFSHFGPIPTVKRGNLFELTRRNPEKVAPVLLAALDDPDRYVIAHIYLTSAIQRKFETDLTHYNGLDLGAVQNDDEPRNDDAMMARLRARWCDTLRLRELVPPCERPAPARPTPRQVDLSGFFPNIAVWDATFVLLDPTEDTISRHNPERAADRLLPGSTYKIPNTLIALESGVAPDADFTLPWDESLKPESGFWAKAWSRDHSLRSALQNSVYWYFQEIARRVGAETMQRYLDQFEYGNRDMDGGLDQFWLHGDLRISANEQVEFLRRMYFDELGVSQRSTALLMEMLLLEDAGDYRIYGKTGTVEDTPRRELAWLVGFVERDERVVFFAMNVAGEEVWERWGPPQKRLDLVRSILRELDVIP